ncbi:MAG: cytochrome c oxidase accessory protein CcoG [Proteobacteria bacterium]|nr:cytochrome c oxidase accessory protein CcoG [Pseudomonadota bacterium]NOG61595.1 cytochrome c oxidase accessory protein CcoG [Pseudomonadota bacterium]
MANSSSEAGHSSINTATNEIEQSLYEKREKIYPRQVKGIFAGLRVAAVIVLLGLYYILPWIEINGQQIVLFDLPARKFYIFGLTFWPQDFLFLAFILILLAFSLFFFTALAGRLWCGYACFQTVWTEVFLWVEHKIEGSRIQQMRLDESDFSVSKATKKVIKHSIWLLIAGATGVTFVAYFSSEDVLSYNLFNFQLGNWEMFWIFFFTAATYINAGFMREQVCKYMCPYARFQSAMFDNDTLIISYDEKRGEPRGSRRSDVHLDYKKQGLGDCINCTMCVQVCPTGIDIRNGLQYECIGCSACIDVCDDVMDRMKYPKGLIRYTTQNAIDGKQTRIIRPRVVIYFILLALFSSLFVYTLSQRSSIALDIIRDRNQLYRETSGLIENIYTLKLINMDDDTHEFNVTVEGIDNLQLLIDKESIIVEAGMVSDLPVRLRAEEENLKGRSTVVYFTVSSKDEDNLSIKQEAKFLGPLQ